MKDITINWHEWRKKNQFLANILIIVFIFNCTGIGVILDLSFCFAYNKILYFTMDTPVTLLNQPMYAGLIGCVIGIALITFLYLMNEEVMLAGLPIRLLSNTEKLNQANKHLLNTVQKISKAMKITFVPRVYLAEVSYPNAFVSGSNEKNQYIVITQGMVDCLSQPQLQAVIASELTHLKMGDNRLTLLVALASHALLIISDWFFYAYLIKPKEKKTIPMRFVSQLLKIQRFLLPLGTFLLRFFLRQDRVYCADQVVVKLMKDNKPLGEALSIVNNIHYERIDLLSKAYAQISHDEIRRESYFIDPAHFNAMQTFATPFTTHPSVEDRLEKIDYAV
ncbi:MAG: M48 family metalloprotease [Gammaproteobacteria bacterium]|nr:M48 family metalloprotease [Gammaproteobacteria bacterium]